MTTLQVAKGRPRRAAMRAGLLAGTVVLLGACSMDEILQVDDPDVASPGTLEGPLGLPVLHAGAVNDFTWAYSGSNGGLQTEGHVTITGLFADEFENTETFNTRLEIDKRKIPDENATVTDNYRDLHRARRAAERAAASFAEHGPDEPERAEVLALAGYTYIMFAENYCSGVPFSETDDSGSPIYGEQQTTEQTFDIAIARLEEAQTLAAAAEEDDLVHLASVGLGRALLGKGDFAAAAAAVADVPDDFVYLVRHSENSIRQNNGVWNFVYNEDRWRVPDAEAGEGLPYRSDNDPRVPWTDPERIGFDSETPIYYQAKYPEAESDVVLASGIEARLIEAEAALKAGNYAAAGTGTLAILNDLRAGTTGLAPLTAAATATAQEDQLFKERAYWLWLTAHRLGDLRRLLWYYDRTASAIFPSGAYHKGGDTYGEQVSLPIPLDEQNNPNFTGCLDTTQ